MAIGQCYGSFPNSRQAARKATTIADTGIVVVNGNAGPNSLIRPANVNRTYLTLRNTGAAPARYGYFDRGTLSLDGMLLNPGDAVDLESPGAVYAIGTGAAATQFSWDQGEG
jgi:hypothetical protein